MPIRNLAKWFRWSNTRQAWQERLGTLGLFGVALFLWLSAEFIPPWLLVAGLGALGLLLAFLWRRGWLKLFGPVLFYDLIRNARRTRFFAFRITYLCILLFLICWMYYSWRPYHALTAPVSTSEAAELALLFFSTFMAVQMVFVVVLTPAFTAGAIAEEKERKTMEFILATDLRNREIVFGKLFSRMAFLSTFILAGLPVLSALQFMGGFSPRALLAGFAGTMLTMASLASMSLLASVLARRTRESLLLVYVVLIAYLGMTVLIQLQLKAGYWNTFPSTATWDSPLTLGDVLLAIRAGNPLFALGGVMSPRGIDENGLMRALGGYAWFHGILTIACAGASVALLRQVSLKETGRAQKSDRSFSRWRPAPGHWPMIWKEVWADRPGKRRWLVGLGMLFLVALSFVPVVFMVSQYFDDLEQERKVLAAELARKQAGGPSSINTRQYRVSNQQYYTYWDVLGGHVNDWVRSVGMLVALLGMAGVGVRAATSIRGEHDRDTMTSLLTTPLSSEEILFGKWLGSLTSMRWLAVWVCLIWAVAVVFNGLTPVAYPLLCFSYLCYVAAAASIGLWCSVVCKTGLRAILATLLIGLILIGGHWIPWMCCIPAMSHSDAKSLAFVAQMQGAVTPPVVLSFYQPMASHDLDNYSHSSDELWNPYWLMFVGTSGAGVWGMLALVVWTRANHRFKTGGGRLDHAKQTHYVPSGFDRPKPVVVLTLAEDHANNIQETAREARILDEIDPPG